MPGLYGIVSHNRTPEQARFATLQRWTVGEQPIIYEHQDNCAMLGFKSLGIVDFPEQPFRQENSALVLFIWGEFYQSSGDLTKIAAQLVNCYRTDDWRQLRTLNGLFSFALWDSNERRLALGSDIYASRPLFYRHSDTDFTFGPSPFAVAAATGKKRIDANALSQFLSFGLVAGDITWFEDVKRLRAGHVLTVDGTGLRHLRYYRPRFTPQRITKRDAAAGLVGHLETALGSVTSGRHALSLSGGGDSRLLLAVADRQQIDLQILAGHRMYGFDIGLGIFKKNTAAPGSLNFQCLRLRM